MAVRLTWATIKGYVGVTWDYPAVTIGLYVYSICICRYTYTVGIYIVFRAEYVNIEEVSKAFGRAILGSPNKGSIMNGGVNLGPSIPETYA